MKIIEGKELRQVISLMLRFWIFLSILKLLVKVPFDLFRCSVWDLANSWWLQHKSLVLHRSIRRLTSRLGDLLSHLLVGWHVDYTISIPEEESILEELLHVSFGLAQLLQIVAGSFYFLLNSIELGHLSSDLSFLLLSLEFLLLDLSTRFPPHCRGFHQVTWSALRY